jgi:hypothetical protein
VTVVRLYFDEDCADTDVAAALRARGFDVLLCQDAGMLGRTDEEHLALAAVQGRALFTGNIRDFRLLDAGWRSVGRKHAGIVLVAQGRWSTGERIRRLIRLCATLTAEEMVDRVEFLSSWGEA